MVPPEFAGRGARGSPLMVRVVVALGLIASVRAIGAEEAPPLPTRIEFTEADCRGINERGTLRGRRTGMGISWSRRRLVWDGVQVFTGRKSDVIQWFRFGHQGFDGRGGFQNIRHMRGFQYDVLCSTLLQTGDIDIVRALLWHARGTGDYTLPEWRALASDRRLTTAERVIAWDRSFSCWSGEPKPIDEFWRLFGDALRPTDLAELHLAARLPWNVLRRPQELKESIAKEKLTKLLLAVLRREYLSVETSTGMSLAGWALRALVKLHGSDPGPVAQQVVDRLVAWDKLGDGRSSVMWHGVLSVVARLDDRAAWEIRALVQTAGVPANAAQAFYAYPRSPLGRKEIQRRGLQAYVQEHLDLAFRKPGDDGRYFLFALAADDTMARRLEHFLAGQKVDITVTASQFALLKLAWAKAPRALDYVIVEEKKYNVGGGRARRRWPCDAARRRLVPLRRS